MEMEDYTSMLDDIVHDMLTIPTLIHSILDKKKLPSKELKEIFFFTIPRTVIGFRWFDREESTISSE